MEHILAVAFVATATLTAIAAYRLALMRVPRRIYTVIVDHDYPELFLFPTEQEQRTYVKRLIDEAWAAHPELGARPGDTRAYHILFEAGHVLRHFTGSFDPRNIKPVAYE